MPTYVYRREDGTTFEIDQRISEPALDTCPTTGQAVKRVITGGTGLIFKGSGFYLTDYARNGKGKSAASPASNGESKPEATAESKSESKSETKKSKSKSEKKAD